MSTSGKEQAEMFFSGLVESLQLLAASAAQQVASFPSFVCVPDELALTFDSFYAPDQLRSSGFLDEDEMGALAAIDDALARMSEDKSLWSLEQLADASAWQEIRTRARSLLATLDYSHYRAGLWKAAYVPQPVADNDNIA